MPGLALEARYQLIREAERRAIAGAGLTPADARILRALAFDFHNGASGRTDPGFRAIARRAACGLATVCRGLRRLRLAGFVAWQGRVLRVGGRWVRWTHAYRLAADLAALRSGPIAEPGNRIQKGGARPRSVAAQLEAVARWAAEWAARRAEAGPPKRA